MEKFYNIDEQRHWNREDAWSNDGHEWSTGFGGTDNIWNNFIFDKIKEFRNKRILEIAPGRGRMTQYLSVLASKLQIVDLNESCIEYTRNKLKHHVDSYFVNDGKSLPVPNETQDLVFSYDSFVHMHKNVVEDYIKEISRVLVPGGKAFIHHSNLVQGTEFSFQNVGGRANMDITTFSNIVEENGMFIVSQEVFKMNDQVNDIISVFMKPFVYQVEEVK